MGSAILREEEMEHFYSMGGAEARLDFSLSLACREGAEPGRLVPGYWPNADRPFFFASFLQALLWSCMDELTYRKEG